MIDDKKLIEKLVELSPYSTIPNEEECKQLFEFFKSESKKQVEISREYLHITQRR